MCHRALRGLPAPRASAKGSFPPASTSARNGPWSDYSLSQHDLDIQLAIAQTNANVNSGRIVFCATDEADDVAAAQGEMFGCAAPAEKPDHAGVHGLRTFDSRRIRGSGSRTTSPNNLQSCNRVVWALPIERSQGAGYSTRILRLSNVRRPCTPAWSGFSAGAAHLSFEEQDSSAQPQEPAMERARKPAIEQDAGTPLGKPRAHGCVVTGRNLAQLRVDLFTRIGLPNSRESPPTRRWKDYGNELTEASTSTSRTVTF